MLALEIEYLAGVAVAASVHSRDEAEWPPHPDRLFSALVCAWAESERDTDEEAALRWLERQPAPSIMARAANPRDIVNVFVPPNDMAVTGRAGSAMSKHASAQLAVLPALRRNRQPRFFPAVVPAADETGCPARHVVFTWTEEPDPHIRDAFARLAGRVAALGHSSSLVRLHVMEASEISEPDEITADLYDPNVTGSEAFRWVAEGRLDALLDGYQSARARNFGRRRGVPAEVFRPSPAPTVKYRRRGLATPSPPASVFGEDWVVFRDAVGEGPALTALPHAAKAMRDALLSMADQPPPEVLSGHAANGAPSKEPHVAIVPLSDSGWEHSYGRLLGLAIVVPRTLEAPEHRDSADRLAVLRAIGRLETRQGDGFVKLCMGRNGAWKLERQPAPELRSLSSDRYTATAQSWSTLTPVVLDRYPKDKAGQSAEDIVARACVNIGLPAPTRVVLHKHAAPRGAPSARPARGNPFWSDWSFPREGGLARRPRTHATLTFEAPVRGPVILGAGRFLGLGLCLPMRERL